MTPGFIDGTPIETYAIDEYVQTDLRYLDLLRNSSTPTLLALVGVQSHQFQRSIDLAAFARANGVQHCVIGGPHPMTCDTSDLQGRGVSFALAEAERIWMDILRDALRGELQPVYGTDQRWTRELDSPVLLPPSKRDLRRYVVPMLGLYPARGCPFTCNFCSVIKIAGRKVRSQPVQTTIESLRHAKRAGIRLIMFTSDNFNKYQDATELLEEMIAERLHIPFFVQCDTQLARQEEFVSLLARAGCFEIFVGIESFRRTTLLAAHKTQNRPETYSQIVALCRKYGVIIHFSNIIGFPDDTDESISEHVRVLQSLSPDMASFYVLTPIPGTDQYDEFLEKGLITERNMDRFDATSSTWRHPNLSSAELDDLMFRCYREYFTAGHILRTAIQSMRSRALSAGVLPYIAHPVFTRFSVARKRHPMSGGIGSVSLDSAADYSHFRRSVFGLDRVPLPKSLRLSAHDVLLNSSA
jgi:hypothetical protein